MTRLLLLVSLCTLLSSAPADAQEPPTDVTSAEKMSGTWAITQTSRLDSCGSSGEKELRLWLVEGVRRVVSVKVTGSTAFQRLEGTMVGNKLELEGEKGSSTMALRATVKAKTLSGEIVIGYMGGRGKMCATIWTITGKRQD